MDNRIDVTKLYAPDNGFYFYVSDYQPMIDAFGNVVVQVDDNDYQGDTRVLYDNDGRIGFLIFGWGSCSGCDALQACENMCEVQELCDSLQDSIKWFDSKEDALQWAKEKDWATEWYWHYKEGKKFIREMTDYLSKKAEALPTMGMHIKTKEENIMYETCGDNRFEIIQKAKEDLIRSTNIEGSPDEMEVLDNILFRAWQMGWLDKYETSAMSFGMAIKAAKNGKKIARKGWNGKSQYVELAIGISYRNSAFEIVNADHRNIGNRALAFVGTSGVQMGWLASQADMLADDWYIME